MVDLITLFYGDNSKKSIVNFIDRNFKILPKGSKLIIVNNNDGEDLSLLEFLVKKMSPGDFYLLNNECDSKNLGSAGGYSLGIQKSVEKSDNKKILLLDQDNLMITEQDSDIWTSLVKEERTIFFQRKDRAYQQKIMEGAKVHDVLPPFDSFLGFDIRYIVSRLLQNKKQQDNINQLTYKFVKVPYGPYGGFFFNKSMIKKIGTPNHNYFIYCDDYEYTYRFTINEQELFLTNCIQIEDVEMSWNVSKNRPFWISILFSSQKYRIYYSIRNRLVFERNLKKSRIRYTINRLVVLSFINLATLFVTKNRKVIKKAINDANSNTVGISEIDFF